MQENVVISIRGQQLFDEGEPDVMELITQGTLELVEDGYNLTYEETELTGLEGTVTTFVVRPNQVSLTRQGKVNSIMVFEEGQVHFSMYETPYGSVPMGVNTRRVTCQRNAAGGYIEIDYSIELDRSITGQNLFQIHFMKATPPTTEELLNKLNK